MSNYVLTTDGELMHYGVPGMKWGKRMARGHAGPGIFVSRKRQLAGDKRDLDILNAGGHLSKGLTKKRQAAYDARDKEALKKRIAENERILDLKNKGMYSKRAEKLNKKANIAEASAREWDEMAKIAKSKGKTSKAAYYSQYAKDDRLAAQQYTQKSKKIVENRLKRKQFVKDVSKTTMDRGKVVADRVKNKLSGK